MATLQLHSPVWYAAVMDVADVPALAVRETNQTGPPKPRLLDRVREAIRTRHSRPEPGPGPRLDGSAEHGRLPNCGVT